MTKINQPFSSLFYLFSPKLLRHSPIATCNSAFSSLILLPSLLPKLCSRKICHGLDAGLWPHPDHFCSSTAFDKDSRFDKREMISKTISSTSTPSLSLSLTPSPLPSPLSLTIKLGKIVHEVGCEDLLLQQVFLVQKQYDWGILEPRIRDDRSKQGFRLFHSVLEEWEMTNK